MSKKRQTGDTKTTVEDAEQANPNGEDTPSTDMQSGDTKKTVEDSEQANPEGEGTPLPASTQPSEDMQATQDQDTQDAETAQQDAEATGDDQTTITATEHEDEQSVSEDGTPRRSILERTGISKLTNELGNMFTGLVGKTQVQATVFEERKTTTQRLKEWAGASLAERQDLYADIPESIGPCTEWLLSLPNEKLKQFVHKLEHFCTDLGFELAWILDPKVTTTPSMKLAMEKVVLQFCLIHWQKTQAHETFVAFTRFLAWKDDPMSKEHEGLTRKLFPKLVEKGLVSEPPAALFLFSEEERRDYVVQSIQEVSQKDVEGLLETIRDV